jgi:hypothetical protein
VASQKEFRERVQCIGELLQELEGLGDPVVRAKTTELAQLLMDMHGTALERVLEIIFQSPERGAALIDELGEDELVSSLLVLHGLHPEELKTRVERKLAQIRSRLFKMGAELTGIVVEGSEVRVRLKLERSSCGSTLQNVKSLAEEAIYEAAPDLTKLVIEGLEEPPASGFVAMEALTGTRSPAMAWTESDESRN